jgi:hypothetical protein
MVSEGPPSLDEYGLEIVVGAAGLISLSSVDF